jgi:esterase/lipase
MLLEDLLNKKKLYEGIKEILEKVINSFSSIAFSDNLLSAKSTLDSYFDIDEEIYSNKITSVNDGISSNINKLKSIVANVDLELEKINKEVIDMQISGTM